MYELGPETMARVRECIKFVMYWFLTYIIGSACFCYYVLCRVLGWYASKEEKVRTMQPACLSDPVYGSHKYFKSQGVKIHYVDSGDKDADVVLLIHGIPGFWFCWRKQIPHLAVHFRVIAIDLPGCGDSESPSNRSSYAKEATTEDIVHLLKSLGCSSVNVVCCETSGHLGWELTTKHPQLVNKMVLINAPHPSILQHLFHVKTYYYFKYWYLLFLQIPCLPEAITSEEQTKGWLKTLLDPALKAKAISDEEVEAYKYTFSRKDDWRGVINQLRQIDLRPMSGRGHPPSVLATPTLVLMGSSHPYLTVEAAYRSAELVERIKVRIIPNAGSNLQVTHSKRVNEELFDFLYVPKPQSFPKQEPKTSLVGRVFGAVTSPYSLTNTGASFSSDLREAAQSTFTTGVNLAQTVWPVTTRSNLVKMSQVMC